MTNSTSFTINNYSTALSHQRVNQLLNATTAEEAYCKNKKGLWSRFCDYFCLGSERKTVRELFNAIVEPEQGINPIEHLNRFKKLKSYATAENKDKFSVSAYSGIRADTWVYEFRIDNSAIYLSEERTESQNHSTRIDFVLNAFTWNIKNDFSSKFSSVDPSLAREKYAEGEIQTLSDWKGNQENDKNQIQSDGKGTSQAYLKYHLKDDFFSSSNFKEIKKVEDNSFFDAVFTRNGEERVLRLSNRESTKGEFRSKIAQDAFQKETYENLKDLLSMKYGTNQDTLLRYYFTPYLGELKNLLGEKILEDEQVRETLSHITLQLPGAAEVITVADFVNQENSR